jgi:type VI secretion system protein ImpB
MSTIASGQDKMRENRPDRVHIEYKIDRGNGVFTPFVLPFIAVSMGEYRGDTKDPKKIKEREFKEVNGGNFNATMASMEPSIKDSVQSVLPGLEGDIPLDLKFKSTSDFRPDAVAQNVAPLKKIWDLRRELENLKTHMDADPKVEEAVKAMIKDGAQGKLKALAAAPNPDAQAAQGDKPPA